MKILSKLTQAKEVHTGIQRILADNESKYFYRSKTKQWPSLIKVNKNSALLKGLKFIKLKKVILRKKKGELLTNLVS